MTKDRNDVIDLCVGLVEAKFGPQPTYEQLTTKLRTEFPELQIKFDEVLEHYSMSIELDELLTQYNTYIYGNT